MAIKMLNISQASTILGITEASLRNKTRAGQIPGAHKLGTGSNARWRFDSEKIKEAFVNPHKLIKLRTKKGV
ncbi:helix-turn-helix domain-containing protein [Patescibacteria group bacterium]|nr:helix-turn-helix domain-containing protein [Patescibacteria group bacterium]